MLREIPEPVEKRHGSGIGKLLNTSSNLNADPVCCYPADGTRTLVNSELGGLYLDGYLIMKDPT